MVRRLSSEGELVRGEREVDPVQALIVERIFRELAAGKSPIAIACDLNAEGVAGPSGKPWRDTSIRGNARRGLGIINNELYVGVRVWNHKHKVKDPTTGKDVTRLNPESEWRSEEHTSELQSLMRISYAVFCLKKKNKTHTNQKR